MGADPAGREHDSIGPAGVDPVSTDPVSIEQWGRDRLGDLVALCGQAFESETLAEEDLDVLAFGDDPSAGSGRRTVVWGTSDGDAAAVVTLSPGDRGAQLHLAAVHPARRRRGRGRAVVGAAEEWASAQGAATMQVGAAVPFYLFSGVDTRWTESLCLFESLGYERTEVVLDLVCPTLQSARRTRPPGVRVDRVETDEQVAALMRFADAEYPHWSEEFARAGESGTAVIAVDTLDGSVRGAAAHSVSRMGVIGPVAVASSGRRSGTGSALMGTVLADLSTAGLRNAEIAWTSTVAFYAKACEAKVGRASQIFRRDLSPVRQD